MTQAATTTTDTPGAAASGAPVIGVSRPRTDSEPKVRGATRFAADLPRPGLLHARLVLAEQAHGLITGIDATGALRIPGVVAVLTAADLALVRAADMRMFEPLARKEIVFAGQPVALVVAESEAAAEDGAEAVTVTVEELPAVLDPVAALRPGSPAARVTGSGHEQDADVRSVHANVGAAAEAGAEGEPANLAGRTAFAAGDVGAALADAASAHRIAACIKETRIPCLSIDWPPTGRRTVFLRFAYDSFDSIGRRAVFQSAGRGFV